MKDNQDLNLIECEKGSHEEAKTNSFRVKVTPQDYDKAMKNDTWPFRVKVCEYRHSRSEDQFGVPNNSRQNNNRQNNSRQNRGGGYYRN